MRQEVKFDIGMGAFHGAQACKILGLFLLNLLKDLANFNSLLYRDDGASARQQEKLRQSIIRIFAE